jgi:hypothetical protein
MVRGAYEPKGTWLFEPVFEEEVGDLWPVAGRKGRFYGRDVPSCEKVSVMNAATQLALILETVRSSDETTVAAAWGKYLEIEYESDEFAYAHAEVLLLLRDAMRYAFALPRPSRERYLKYSKAWWAACLYPSGNWEGGRPSTLISTSELDHLASLGDVLEASLAGTMAVPKTDHLAELTADAEAWQDVLKQTDIGIPEATRLVLRAQVAHILWLIKSVDTYGPTRVAEEAGVFATSIATATPQVPEGAARGEWTARAQDWVAKVSLFTVAIAGPLAISAAATAYSLQSINTVVDQVGDLLDGFDAPTPVAPPAPTLQGSTS